MSGFWVLEETWPRCFCNKALQYRQLGSEKRAGFCREVLICERLYSSFIVVFLKSLPQELEVRHFISLGVLWMGRLTRA